jgi:hypothetical protein
MKKKIKRRFFNGDICAIEYEDESVIFINKRKFKSDFYLAHFELNLKTMDLFMNTNIVLKKNKIRIATKKEKELILNEIKKEIIKYMNEIPLPFLKITK